MDRRVLHCKLRKEKNDRSGSAVKSDENITIEVFYGVNQKRE
jgi:hypothetical protein